MHYYAPDRFGFVLCLSLVVPAAAAADDDLIGRVRDGHRAARDSVRTLSATVTTTSEKDYPHKGIMAQAKYWRSGNTAHIQQGREGSHTEDFLLREGEIRQVGRSWEAGKPSPTAVAYRSAGDTFLGPCDAWREMLIEISGPEGGQLTLDRTLDAAEGPVRADRDPLDGRDCIRLRYSRTYPTGAKENITQWHDVGRNYLICKMEVVYPNDASSMRSMLQVLDFIEPSPGVIFPVRVQREHFRKGEVFSVTVTTLSDVVINQPVLAASLALPPISRGTILHDRIEGNEGAVDSNWKPIGLMKPLTPRPVPPANRAPPADTAQSTSEPVSSSRWILGASVAIILLAGCVVFVRRLRAGYRSVA